MDNLDNNFASFIEQKKKILHLLKLKKKSLYNTDKSASNQNNHFRHFFNYLKITAEDEKLKCENTIKTTRSFTLLCEQNGNKISKFINQSSWNEFVILHNSENLEFVEKNFAQKLLAFNKNIFSVDKEDESVKWYAETENDRNKLESEVLRLRQAFLLSWKKKIQEELHCAELKAQIKFLENQQQVDNIEIHPLVMSKGPLLKDLTVEATHEIGIPVLVNHEAIRLAKQESYLQRLRSLLQCGVIPQRAWHELLVMLAELERLAIQHATGLAQQIVNQLNEWKIYYTELKNNACKGTVNQKSDLQKYNAAIFSLKKCLLSDQEAECLYSETSRLQYFVQPLPDMLANRKEFYKLSKLSQTPAMKTLHCEVNDVLALINSDPVIGSSEEKTAAQEIIDKVDAQLNQVKQIVRKSIY